ncbi:MAG: hypothetical protein J5999_03575 [Oscillospiraceae bacterium]|nr:hypothetical protein [Oscillospiraceae bacterium]
MKKSAVIFLMVICCICLTSCSKLLDISGNENSDYIKYNGILYNGAGFYAVDDLRLIGHIKDGADVYAVGNDQPPQFIIICGSDNSGCFAVEDAYIPTSGRITRALIEPATIGTDSQYLSTDDELAMLAKITNLTGEPQEFLVDNYYTEGNEFYYVYNDSNVTCSDNYGGYVAYTDGKWIYSAPGESIERKEHNTVLITGIVIEDEELINEMCGSVLTNYFNIKAK